MPAKIDTKKMTAYIRVRTGKRVTVIKGTQGPATDGKKILLGDAVKWTPVERLGALNHEGAHIRFPAAYEAGNYHGLSNMIDDARIERQWIGDYPQDEDSLVVLTINVIANQKYATDEDFADRWDAETFDPCTWALLFFRTHLPRDVRVAATKALRAYIQENDLRTEVEDFDQNFRALVETGLRISRLATVARSTLKDWCDLYMKVFPTAESQPQNQMGQDNQAGTGGKGKDAEGEGSEPQDQKDADKAVGTVSGKPDTDEDEDDADGGKSKDDEDEDGEDSAGQKIEQKDEEFGDEEADDIDDLEGALEDLKNKTKEAGKQAEVRAEEGDDDDDDDDDGKGVETGDDDEDENTEDEEYTVNEGIGSTAVDTSSRRNSSIVDRGFVNRVRTSIRQLRFVAEDEEEDMAKAGRLNMPTVIRGERRGILPRRPFEKTIDNVTEVPVACVVATDFSTSTSGMNAHLNMFMHNALYALQAASCENAGVVWNCSAKIVKRLTEEISPVECRRHNSDGGTDLKQAAKGCADALKGANSPRKVAFIFTDGEVYDEEMPVVDAFLKKEGFEAVLLVSLGTSVKRKGMVDTATCTNLGGLANIFEKWVRQQVGKGVNASA